MADVTPLSPTAPIFNKYYSDLLKNLKNTCKQIRDNESEEAEKKKLASATLKAIKTHYGTFDHHSEDYVKIFTENTKKLYDEYLVSGNEYIKTANETEMFKDIPLTNVKMLMPEVIYVNYLATFGILIHAYSNGYSDEKVKEVIDAVRNAQKLSAEDQTIQEAMGTDIDPVIRKYISYMNDESLDMPFREEFKEIESTAIGRLAKEIVDDLKIDGGEFNPMDMFTGGSDMFAKLFTNVGSKIQNKLASGELNQQALMNDAMQLATKLPQMLPTGALGGMEQMLGGNMQDMIANFQKMMSGSSPQARNMRASQKLKKKLRDRK